MAFTRVDSSTVASTADSTSESLVAPSRAAGDTLFAVLNASGANSTISAPSGWTVIDNLNAPHARMYLIREATNTSADDITITVNTGDGISGVMVSYRGMSYDDWVFPVGEESDTSSPYVTPFSGAVDIGVTNGVFVGMFSCQQNGGQGGGMVVSADSGGSLVAQAEGIRTSFSGGLCAVADNLNTTGSQQIGITFTGNATSAFTTIYAYNVTAAVTIPTQGPFTPVRSNARMDALSAARNFTAPPSDLSVEQAFLLEPLEVIAPDIVVGFDEALTPGTVEFVYTPLGQQSRDWLQEFTGETSLARMARTFPPAIMTLVSDVSDAIISDNLTADNTVSARYVIEYVFQKWAAQYPWFNFVSPVPDLRILLYGVANDEYTAGMGVTETPTITIPQIDDGERSMLDLMQELLAPFGAFKTMDGTNNVVIRPRYGPDADSSPVVTLKDNDVYSESTGDPSRVGTKNRIVLKKRPFDKDVDVTAMQEAYWQIRAYLFETQYMITDRTADPPDAIPDSRLDLTDGTGASGTLGYGANYPPLFWPAAAGIVPQDIGFVDSLSAITLDVDFFAYHLGAPGVNVTKSLSDAEVTLATIGNILIDDAEHTAFRAVYTNTFGSMYVELAGRWINEPGRRGVQLRITDSHLVDAGWLVGASFYPGTFVGTFAIDITDSSSAWTDRGTITTVTTAAYESGELTLEAPDGTNAVENSITARGVLEEVIDIGPYNPSLEQMQDMAAALLLDKIQPRAIRILEQGVVRAHPVRFEHVGRLVQLPSGEQGIVTSRDYQEQAGAVGTDGSLSCEIEVMTPIVGVSGEVDGTLEFVLRENGSTISLEQGGGNLLMESSP